MVADVAAPISSNAAVEARSSLLGRRGVSGEQLDLGAHERLVGPPEAQAELLVRRRRVPEQTARLVEVAAHRDQPGEARVDRPSQRRVEPELVPQILDSGDRLVDRSRPVQQRLRRAARRASRPSRPRPAPGARARVRARSPLLARASGPRRGRRCSSATTRGRARARRRAARVPRSPPPRARRSPRPASPRQRRARTGARCGRAARRPAGRARPRRRPPRRERTPPRAGRRRSGARLRGW